MNQAADLLRQAEGMEKDPEDQAFLAELVSRCRKFTGLQQAMIDKAVGVGPSVKLVRKGRRRGVLSGERVFGAKQPPESDFAPAANERNQGSTQ